MNDHRAPDPTPDTGGPDPCRHLLVLIADALRLPEPARYPEHEAAYLRLVSRRAGLVLAAVQTALASPGGGGLANASAKLYSAVSDLPPTSYVHARHADRISS